MNWMILSVISRWCCFFFSFLFFLSSHHDLCHRHHVLMDVMHETCSSCLFWCQGKKLVYYVGKKWDYGFTVKKTKKTCKMGVDVLLKMRLVWLYNVIRNLWNNRRKYFWEKSSLRSLCWEIAEENEASQSLPNVRHMVQNHHGDEPFWQQAGRQFVAEKS